MIRVFLALILTVPLCVLCACGGGESSEILPDAFAPPESTYQKITAEQAKSKMEENDNYILLDVRTDEEFKEKHINGAVLIPDYEIRSRVEAELTDKDALILIYCRSGRRSAIAVRELLDLGYTNVFDLGGIIDWPYGTVSES